MDFTVFKHAVALQFEHMQASGLYRVAVEKDDLWNTYLSSFPAGTNPIFRERTEHDCSCCKQFIRAVGDVVAIIDGKLVSIWDVNVGEPAYQTVANALSALVKSKPVVNRFLHYEATAGTDKNFEQIAERTQTWNHFFINIPVRFRAPGKDIPTQLGATRTQQEMLYRALTEITDEAVSTVIELVAQGSLYRGEEHKYVLSTFKNLRDQFANLPDEQAKLLFTWAVDATGSVARIRNTAIGTLLVDLSEGKEIEDAVRAFEAVVAPANYKRPTALVTKAMIEKAKEKVAELGLTSALERRYATLRDITVNNILFADHTARRAMRGGDVFEQLAAATSSRTQTMQRVEDVPIDTFLTEILPKVDTVEVLLENKHAGNFVSLIAPADPTAGKLFKWDNGFSWSYAGEMADSIKERVKKAGGNVTGDLCCRLAWHNYDDLDFHMLEPNGDHIYFAAKRSAQGMLDVDMNAGGGHSREPVENIVYADKSRMRHGEYNLYVNQYRQRETTDTGFECEIDFMGQVFNFVYAKPVKQGENVPVAKFLYDHKAGFQIIESLPSTQAVRRVWGLPTQSFHKVNTLMLSPNYWDGQGVGNKHYFFMLQGCLNDGTARGFFNEFLDSRLDPHRKVFEMVGSRMKAADDVNQMSGLGFSSTQRNTLTVRVKGSFTRTINIVF